MAQPTSLTAFDLALIRVRALEGLFRGPINAFLPTPENVADVLTEIRILLEASSDECLEQNQMETPDVIPN